MLKDQQLLALAQSAQRIAMFTAVGPGDTLRLVHMLRMLDLNVPCNQALVITPHTNKGNYRGLFGVAQTFKKIPNIGTFIKEGKILWLEAEKLKTSPESELGNVLLDLGIDQSTFRANNVDQGQIVTCFQSHLISNETTSYDAITVLSRNGDKYPVKRRDVGKLMNVQPLKLPLPKKKLTQQFASTNFISQSFKLKTRLDLANIEIHRKI